jgi:hypothetical membrane protein
MPILFTLLVIIESLLRPGYSQIHIEISYLGIGPYSIIQNTNFIISGLLSIAFAIGLGLSLSAQTRQRIKKIIEVLMIIFGVGVTFAGISLILVSIFTTDYVFYIIHLLATFIAFFTIIITQLLIWWALRRTKNITWGYYPKFSLLTGLLSIIMLIIFLYTITNPFQGLTERLFIIVPFIWIEVTGLKLYSMIK